MQPPTTRVLDLTVGEEALRADLKRKHRQYVNKAERAGVTIERFDGSTPPDVIGPALADFNRIYRSTAERAGFVARQAFYYERVWSLFAPTGRVRLSFALLDGERVATIYHFTCGDRAVEAYGGMTDAGAEARANYLLKWVGHRRLRARGVRGLRHVGTRHRRHPPVQGGLRRSRGRVRRRAGPRLARTDSRGPPRGDSDVRVGAARSPAAARRLATGEAAENA